MSQEDLAERVSSDVNALARNLVSRHVGEQPLPRVAVVTALSRKVRRFQLNGLLRLSESREGTSADVQVWEHDSGPVATLIHGVGGPSADRILLSAAQRGVRAVIRVGTCGLLTEGAPIGTVVAVESATGDDTVFRWYQGEREEDMLVQADPALIEAARHGMQDGERTGRAHVGRVFSTSLIFREDADAVQRYRQLGCIAADMESATILACARRYGIPAMSILIGGDHITEGGHHSSADELFQSGVDLMHNILNAVIPRAQLLTESQP